MTARSYVSLCAATFGFVASSVGTVSPADAAIPVNSCHFARAAVAIKARVPGGNGTNGYATAMLYSRERGEQIVADARSDAADRLAIRKSGYTPASVTAIAKLRQERALAALGGPDASQEQRVAAFEKMLAADKSGMSDPGVSIPVGRDGTILCEGVPSGAYELVATVVHFPPAGAATAGTVPGPIARTTYAIRVDVPVTPRGKRFVVNAGTLSRVAETGS